MAAHFRELERDEHCSARLDVVLDLSDATSLPSSDQLRLVRQEDDRVHDTVRFGLCAIVANTDAWFGTAMVFEVLTAQTLRKTKVFRDLEAAEAWLKEKRFAA